MKISFYIFPMLWETVVSAIFVYLTLPISLSYCLVREKGDEGIDIIALPLSTNTTTQAATRAGIVLDWSSNKGNIGNHFWSYSTLPGKWNWANGWSLVAMGRNRKRSWFDASFFVGKEGCLKIAAFVLMLRVLKSIFLRAWMNVIPVFLSM